MEKIYCHLLREVWLFGLHHQVKELSRLGYCCWDLMMVTIGF
jgi:hypothetical protein